MDENEDAKLFLRDAGKTAEETVERLRGFEENYHYLLHTMMLALPWLDGSVSETLHQFAEEDFGAALQFARNLQQAGDFQQAARLQTKYAENCAKLFWTQARDFAEFYAGIRAPAITLPEGFRLPLGR
jgi:Phasin protein